MRSPELKFLTRIQREKQHMWHATYEKDNVNTDTNTFIIRKAKITFYLTQAFKFYLKLEGLKLGVKFNFLS